MMKFTCRHKCLSLNNPVGEGPVEGHVYTGPVIRCHCRGLQGAVTISRVMDSSSLGCVSSGEPGVLAKVMG